MFEGRPLPWGHLRAGWGTRSEQVTQKPDFWKMVRVLRKSSSMVRERVLGQGKGHSSGERSGSPPSQEVTLLPFLPNTEKEESMEELGRGGQELGTFSRPGVDSWSNY